MARRGTWELKELVLRYSVDGGSSRGVREFVEQDLVRFARENPQINIITSFRNSHPFVAGRYTTGYARQLNLRNHDRDSVAERIQYLRDSIGIKLPTHNAVGMGVVNRDKVSIQGFWHNSAELRVPPHPFEVELRNQREHDYGLGSLVKEVGFSGIIQITDGLRRAQQAAKEKALAALPKKQKTPATE